MTGLYPGINKGELEGCIKSSGGGNKVTDKSWTTEKKKTKLVDQIISQQTVMVVASKAAIRCCDYFTHLFKM